MKYRIRIIVLGVAIAAAGLAACGGGGSAKPDAAVDAYSSTCGKPGDMGNELGVGKFCPTLGDCSGTPDAPLCSTLGDPMTHFCTKTCTANGPAAQCGTGATCTCNSSNQCGCTPNTCLN